MKATIYISGRIERGETLKDVIRQYKSFEEPTELTVDIDSQGGNKYEGEAVHDYLKAIDASGVPVTTKTNKAYSIAARIFAAGSTRIIADEPSALGIHFARVTPSGDYTAEQLEAITAEMFAIKKEFINFYADHLDIDKATVENLLENETVMSGKEAVDLGFATQLNTELEIAAELNFDKLNNMTEKKKSKRQIAIEAFLDLFTPEKEEPEVKAELVLQDSTGAEIKFPDLEPEDLPKVGDTATLNGVAVEDGSYIMPSLEGEPTVTFVGGKVEKIEPKEEEAEGDPMPEEQPAEAESVEANIEAIEKAKADARAEVTAEMKTIIEAKDKEIFELNKKISSPEFTAEIKENDKQKQTSKPKTFAEILRG
jgi:ATP-dependent protease ClpP protease subunit